MRSIPQYIRDEWPKMVEWPSGIGQMPSEANVSFAGSLVSRPSTAVQMALAMYFRQGGATDREAATAATAATGAISKTHRVKRDSLVKEGRLRQQNVGKRDGQMAVRIVLP